MTYEIFDGEKTIVVMANNPQDAVKVAGFAENTMLEVKQVCSFCEYRTKFYRNDCCLQCWNEMHK